LLKYNNFIIFYRRYETDPSVSSLLKRHLARPIAHYEKLAARIDGNIKLTEKKLTEDYNMAASNSEMLEAIRDSMKIEKDSQEEAVFSMIGAAAMVGNRVSSEDAEWVNPAGKN